MLALNVESDITQKAMMRRIGMADDLLIELGGGLCALSADDEDELVEALEEVWGAADAAEAEVTDCYKRRRANGILTFLTQQVGCEHKRRKERRLAKVDARESSSALGVDEECGGTAGGGSLVEGEHESTKQEDSRATMLSSSSASLVDKI